MSGQVKWTRFMDMHSGGGQKEDFAHLLVELPEKEARVFFYNRFGHSPDRVTCTCCGEDYSVSESDSIADATAYDRRLRYAEDRRGWHYGKNRPADYLDGRYLEPDEDVPDGMKVDRDPYGTPVTLAVFMADPKKYGYRIIPRSEISDDELRGEVPAQGFVWVD